VYSRILLFVNDLSLHSLPVITQNYFLVFFQLNIS